MAEGEPEVSSPLTERMKHIPPVVWIVGVIVFIVLFLWLAHSQGGTASTANTAGNDAAGQLSAQQASDAANTQSELSQIDQYLATIAQGQAAASGAVPGQSQQVGTVDLQNGGLYRLIGDPAGTVYQYQNGQMVQGTYQGFVNAGAPWQNIENVPMWWSQASNWGTPVQGQFDPKLIPNYQPTGPIGQPPY